MRILSGLGRLIARMSRCTTTDLATHRGISLGIPWKSPIAQPPSDSVGCSQARRLGAAGTTAGASAGWEYDDPSTPRPYDAGSVAPLSGNGEVSTLATGQIWRKAR